MITHTNVRVAGDEQAVDRSAFRRREFVEEGQKRRHYAQGFSDARLQVGHVGRLGARDDLAFFYLLLSVDLPLQLCVDGRVREHVEERHPDRRRRGVRSREDLSQALAFCLDLTHAVAFEAAKHVFVLFRAGLEPVSHNLPRYAEDCANAPRVLRRWRRDTLHHPAVEEFFDPGMIAAKLHHGHESSR